MENLYYRVEQRLDNNIKRLTTLKDIIKTLDTKYNNKLIHVTDNGELNLDETFGYNVDNEKGNNLDNELKGLWLSCGSNWIKWVMLKSDDYCFNDNFLKTEFIYEIEIKGKKILYINTLDELIDFHNKYSYCIENIGYNIYWDKVKELYDGMIIDTSLAYNIWEGLNNIGKLDKNEDFNLLSSTSTSEKDTGNLYENNLNKNNDDTTIFFINPMAKDNKADNLKESMLKHASFYLNWYTKWGTFTGILWNKNTIKKVKILKFKIIKK